MDTPFIIAMIGVALAAVFIYLMIIIGERLDEKKSKKSH
jgi:hypothetical protein